MECERFRQLLLAYLDEVMSEGERSWWRQHLRECRTCRQWAITRDPSLLFAAQRVAPADLPRVESCVTAVTALVRHDRLSHRLSKPRSVLMAAAAAVLLCFIGAAVWYVSLHNEPALVPPAVVETQLSTEAAPPMMSPEAEVVMDQENVRVYHLTNEEENVAVAFIVNPALEL